MRTVLVSLCLALLTPAPGLAAALNGCDTSWRLGGSVLRTGDDVGRVLSTIRSNRHRVEWVRGPKGQSWTLRQNDPGPRTVSVKIRDGRIARLCQYSR